jgi:hypothetical protein
VSGRRGPIHAEHAGVAGTAAGQHEIEVRYVDVRLVPAINATRSAVIRMAAGSAGLPCTTPLVLVRLGRPGRG